MSADELLSKVNRYLDKCVWVDDCLINPARPTRYGEIRHSGRRTTAHRAVYMALCGPVENDEVVRHKCDNPPCVNPQHLEPGSVSLNSRDMYERSRVARSAIGVRGEANPSATLTADLVIEMRRAARAGQTIRSIADGLGVSYPAARQAIRGNTWHYLPEPPVAQERRWGRRNSGRLSDEIAAQARALAAEGLSLREIGERLGVHRSTAYELTHRVAS